MYQRIAAESDEVKRADMLKAVAVSPDLDPKAFVQFLNQMISSPDSSDRWKEYCLKVRQYVIQKYKAANKAQVRPEKPVQAQTGDHEGRPPVNHAKTSDPHPAEDDEEGKSIGSSQQAPAPTQTEVESTYEPKSEEISSESKGQGWQGHVDGVDEADHESASELVHPPAQEQPEQVHEEDIYDVQEEAGPLASDEDPMIEESHIQEQSQSELPVEETSQKVINHGRETEVEASFDEDKNSPKPAKKTGKRARKKKRSGILVPEGITVGWILGMMLASALILPWAWLIAKIFWGIASKLLPV